MIVILDYDMGNVGSIKNILHAIGEDDVTISRDHLAIKNADRLILPGVGAFDKGMENLEKYDLIDLIKEHAGDGKPLLGICLGMQLLGKSSEEGIRAGLSLIPFSCKKFIPTPDLKVPHMGWNYIVGTDERYYFVHSYYAVCEDESNVFMECEYGHRFVAAVKKDNIMGVQFHPEKSHKYGMNLLKRFLAL